MISIMTNKITPTPGHTQLTDDQFNLIQKVRTQGKQLTELIELLQSKDTDKRWVSIGQTDLQKGLMALVRSIAKPDFF